MAVTIRVNGLTLSHKGSGGYVRNTAPDVCLTPAGPSMVPVPYSIISFSKDLVRGSTSVFADGGNSISVRGSAYSKCTGDEPGTGRGVISGTNRDEATWITFSPNVYIEAKNVCRKTDKMFMNKMNTISGAGGDYEPPLSLSKLEKELCRVFCEARDEWHKCKRATPKKKCPRPSTTAKRKMKARQSKIDDLVKKKYGKGYSGHAEKSYFKKATGKIRRIAKKYKRKIYSPDAVKRSLRRQLKKRLAKTLKKKAVKKAATAWMKFVPGLNVLSTAYDVYDLAVTGKEFYDLSKKLINQVDFDAVKVTPDFGIEGPDGQLKDIYDFKFDDPEINYQDDWQKNGQEELYKASTGKDPKKINNRLCKCDKGK